MNIGNQELSHRTLSEGVEKLIRGMILNGELQLGERINEVALSERLRMSRGPIREALRRLQTEGLVVYHPHKGTRVATLTTEDAREIYSLRGLLESEAARLALPRLKPADLQQLEQKIQQFSVACKEGDVQALIQLDSEFHNIVVQAAGHSRLTEMYKSLDTQLGVMFLTIRNHVPARFARMAEIHLVLVDALVNRDEKVVISAFRNHYEEAWKAIAAALSKAL